MMDLNLEQVDLYERKNYEFSVLFARYMLDENYKAIEKQLALLAFRGNLNALIFYCYYNSHYKEGIETLAWRKTSKKNCKTPEEWLLQAMIWSHDLFKINGKKLTLEEVTYNIKSAMGDLTKMPDPDKAQRIYYMFEPFFKSRYFNAIQKAKEGFLERAVTYKKEQDGFRFMDYCKYVELSSFPYNYQTEEDGTKPRLCSVAGTVDWLKKEYKKKYENIGKLTLEEYFYAEMLLHLEDDYANKQGLDLFQKYSKVQLNIEPESILEELVVYDAKK